VGIGATCTELHRVFVAPELQVRAASKGGDGRTIEGIAVPWGVRQRITPWLDEQFARGAFNHQLAAPNRVRFARDHFRLIGRAVELRDDAAGLWGAWRVSKTDAGEETLELVRDGVLDQLSVGFRERQNRRLDDGTVPGFEYLERVTAQLVEVSVVMEGAYGDGAGIAGVRSAPSCSCGSRAAAPAEPAGTPRLDRLRAVLDALPALPGA
jgi:HK97 family phage prohead protease